MHPLFSKKFELAFALTYHKRLLELSDWSSISNLTSHPVLYNDDLIHDAHPDALHPIDRSQSLGDLVSRGEVFA